MRSTQPARASIFGASLAVGMVLGAAAVPVRAEVFVLSTGGRVEGDLLNPDEVPRRSYEILAGSGARITLDARQVAEVLHVRPEVQEYERIRPNYPDTIAAQWALAEWCRERSLLDQRDVHLERIIELDPDHVEARRALGYGQIGGQWMRQDEVMAQRGYVRYQGRWRTQQEIDLLEERRARELVEKEWYQKLKRWRGWLGTDRDLQARQHIAAIDDPHAVPALAAGLKQDTFVPARLLYIERLGRIGSTAAGLALAESAIDDAIDEVRLSCLDQLQKRKCPEAVAYFVGKLKSKDNRVVNRAGLALGRMGDSSAVAPLIDALVTTHRYRIVTGNPGSISTTFPTGGTGGGGLAMGGGPTIVTRQLTNQAVLDALVALSGTNFNYNQQAWRAWYASQRRPARIDARRD
jgi:hypothetical protein